MAEQGSNGTFRTPEEKEQESRFKLLGEISRPGETASVPSLVDFVIEKAREHGFGEPRIEELAGAARAAVTSAIAHAYAARTGDILVTCKADAWDSLVIILTDTGTPYNILLADTPFDEGYGDEQDKAAARLIKKTIDNIEYKIFETKNILTLTASGKPRTQ
jgi:anti-sigma regulatory factor (Ser/Thr protein kinase)